MEKIILMLAEIQGNEMQFSERRKRVEKLFARSAESKKNDGDDNEQRKK
jgi:hypothetical protein